MTRAPLPADLALVAIDAIQPCPIQPRVNTSVDFVNRLAESMRSGRHDPLIEVERLPGHSDRYQILCGEQRWRAARAAGLEHLLVRVHSRLGYLERLAKQYEENRLRADLDPVEEACCIVAFRTLREVEVAEQLLHAGLVPFQPLDDKRIERREQFTEHLDDLRRLLRQHNIECETLSTWSETEKALGISESQRKAKVGILRIDPELHDAVRDLPAEHAVQISRLPDSERQAELVARAPELTHSEVHRAVARLREDADLTVDEALAPAADASQSVAFDEQLLVLGDLCRQLVRLILLIRDDADRRAAAAPALSDLRSTIDELLEAA